MVVARTVWWWRALAVPLLLATSCTGDDDTTATTATADPDAPSAPTVGSTAPPTPGSTQGPATTAPPTTTVVVTTSTLPVDTGPLGVLDAAIAPDGTIDLDAALSLVAAGYGPLPGVTPAAAPLVDGGPALRTVVAGIDDITPEQQTAVAGIIAPPGTPLATAATAVTPVTATAASVATSSLAAFGWTAEQVPMAILELPFDNGNGTRNFSSPGALATAVIVPADEQVECRLRVDAAAVPTDPTFAAAVARETYHCGQYLALGAGLESPAWVLEGAAAFAADRVAGANALTRPSWERWVLQPQRPLPARTSDAIGFFVLVGDAADPFAFAAALLGDPSVDSVRRRLELTDLFDRWGREYATRPDWEGGFAFTAPGAAGLDAPRTPVALAVDGPATVLTGGEDLNAMPYAITAPGDVLVVDNRTRQPRRDPHDQRTGQLARPGDAGVVPAAQRLRVPRRGPRRAQRR